MKSTTWQELKLSDCTILESYNDGDSLKISHPDLKRPRYFVRSLKGNYYSRYTGKQSDSYAQGYIIK